LVQAQQPPDIGIAPRALTQDAYFFETSEQHRIRVVVVVKGLKHPFSVAFLPTGDALVSERGASLRFVHNATGASGKETSLDPTPVSGVPELLPSYRNGGLHDLALHPDFERNGLVYFTYNKPGRPPATEDHPMRRESRIALMRSKLVGQALTEVTEIFAGESGTTGGSRIAFGKDGTLYMTTGAPFGPEGQQLQSVYGKVLRMRDDGSVPSDNPFVGRADARGEVYSYGHRDQLGLTVHPLTGAVLAAEHGPN